VLRVAVLVVLLLCVQDVSVQLKQMYNCAPVFIDQDVRDKYYKGGQLKHWVCYVLWGAAVWGMVNFMG